ncbi:MAG: DUF1990 family protein [Solirubrobacteraceae bacterium]
MPRRPKRTQRWATAATWPVGIVLTSWGYTWRTTPMHRRETVERAAAQTGGPISFPPGVNGEDVQGHERGHGPLFHRRYRTRIRDPRVSAEDLMTLIKSNVNKPAPTTLARFQKVLGQAGTMAVGDEYVVRMPGPWDGPVRVIELTPCSFRLATLKGHLEAGQIEFRAGAGREHELLFEIESWARSSDWLSNLLYHHMRMAKEVQLHMWISFLEGVVALTGGAMTGGIDIDTLRIEAPHDRG